MDKIFLAVGLIDVGGAIICIGVALHMAYTKADILLGCFGTSPGVKSLAPLRYGGPWGKLLLVGGISGFVTFSRFYIRRGSVSAEDVNRLPAQIRNSLVVFQWCAIGLLVVMVCIGIVAKSGLV